MSRCWKVVVLDIIINWYPNDIKVCVFEKNVPKFLRNLPKLCKSVLDQKPKCLLDWNISSLICILSVDV